MSRVKRAKTITIRFKNNKVSSVTGTRSKRLKAEAEAFGQAFVDAAKAPVEAASSKENNS